MRVNRSFASDNNSGIHPEILTAISDANVNHALGYGEDDITEQAVARFRELFGQNTDVFFVFNGTGANVLSLLSLANSYQAIICPKTAHVNVDECGAPEKQTGCKFLPVETEDGKITIDGIRKYIFGIGEVHHVQPKVISITQSTEVGTLYTIDEIKEIADFAHQNNMFLHMDGARISNAVAALDCTFKEMTVDAGVDVLSFGGTKNGLMFGEAVLFFNRNTEDIKYIRKQTTQLCSKMRFISAQFLALLNNDLWKRNALHANKMAQLLAEKLKEIKEVKITQKVESNGVFAIVPEYVIEPLRKEFYFFMWDESRSEVRWMTTFDTTEEDIDNFVAVLKEKIYSNIVYDVEI